MCLLGLQAGAQTSAPAPVASPSGNLRDYQAISNRQRFGWALRSTLGPESLVAGAVTAGYGTAIDKPSEYGPHWDGFGKRYGMRLTGVATSNTIESSLGSLWGEDPRYFRAPNQPFKSRLRRVVLTTFTAPGPDGHYRPAYARFVAIPANNFLSNTWRADSESDNRDAALRTLYGFLGRMGSNAFAEFWPDVKQRAFHGR